MKALGSRQVSVVSIGGAGEVITLGSGELLTTGTLHTAVPSSSLYPTTPGKCKYYSAKVWFS